MRRVVSLFLPTWATDRLRRRNGGLPPPGVPLISALQSGNQRLIASVDEAAARLKLKPGMTIEHAQSLVPNLNIHDAMPVEDEAWLVRLTLWCTRYSTGPRIYRGHRVSCGRRSWLTPWRRSRMHRRALSSGVGAASHCECRWP